MGKVLTTSKTSRVSRRSPLQKKFGSSAMALALATVFSSVSLPVEAAGLGRLTVQSALGQPLLAEVEITSLTDDEASSLKARLARPDAFRQAGLEFNPALTQLRFDVQRNGAGATVRITSAKPINEPFVDLLVELTWSNGKFVREYTFLLDPPELRVGQPRPIEGGASSTTVLAATQAPNSAVAPAAARVPSSEAPAPVGAEAARAARIAAARRAYEAKRAAEAAGAAGSAVAGTAGTAGASSAGTNNAGSAAAPAAQRSSTPSAAPVVSDAPGTRRVQSGDTLARIARELQPNAASLNQAMVAIYRKNTGAFFGGVHQLRAGAELVMPEQAEIDAISSAEAVREIQASNEAWREYRARLADAAGEADEAQGPVADSDAAVGSIGEASSNTGQTVTDTDELKLSRDATGASGAATSASGQSDAQAKAAESDIARDTALRNAQGRVSELERNVADLQRLLELKNKQLADLGNQVVKLQSDGSAAGATMAPVTGDVTSPMVAETPADPQASTPMTEPAAGADASATDAGATAPTAPTAPIAGADAGSSDAAASMPLPAVDTMVDQAGDKAASMAADATDKMAAGVDAAADTMAGAADAARASAENAAAGAGAAVNDATDQAAAAAAAVAARAQTAVAPTPAPVAPVEENLVDTVMNSVTSNPIVPIGAAALIAIGGFFAWRRRKSKGADDSFEDTLGGDDAFAANSLFGTTGGHDVDTNNTLFNTAAVSDTSVDVHTTEVDPIAEAEVYIAYGREAQAEEILKEALKRQPDRQAIRLKLLEIYAGRKDAAAYGAVAREMYDATGGQNEEWPKVITMGLAIDPENPLYTGDGEIADPPMAGVAGLAGAGAAASVDGAADLMDALSAEGEPSITDDGATDLQSFSDAGDDTGMEQPKAAQVDPDEDLDGLDFDLDITTEIDTTADLSRDADTLSAALQTNVEMPTLELEDTLQAPEPAAIADMDDMNMEIPSLDSMHGQAGGGGEANEVDLASIGLDLSTEEADTAPAGDGAKWQEMATKLDLASAYEEIGDKEGARELLDEVIKDGDNVQQQKARAMLSKIS